ncbi:hypothetical protein B0H14DRAFT_3508055 [Mycena olivaceomarginata]|nr:hypothetical protein B0H14DRAFT_3508055 [Mycena olivaceomarginata]
MEQNGIGVVVVACNTCSRPTFKTSIHLPVNLPRTPYPTTLEHPPNYIVVPYLHYLAPQQTPCRCHQHLIVPPLQVQRHPAARAAHAQVYEQRRAADDVLHRGLRHREHTKFGVGWRGPNGNAGHGGRRQRGSKHNRDVEVRERRGALQDSVEARLDVAGKGGQCDECVEIGDVVRNPSGDGDAVNDEVGDEALDFGDGEMGSGGFAEGEGPKFLHSVRNVLWHVPASRQIPEDEPSEPPTPELWTPPDADPTLEIPGEKILAREKNTSKVYWPAQIKEYIRPKGPSKPPLYEIEWMDTLRVKITRNLFYTFEKDGFRTCVLRNFESSFDEVVNDTDNGPVDVRHNRPCGASPEPVDPPLTGHVFTELGIHEQFVYTKPVLQAILRDEYAPAQEVHRQFVSGGVRGQNSVVPRTVTAGLTRGL